MFYMYLPGFNCFSKQGPTNFNNADLLKKKVKSIVSCVRVGYPALSDIVKVLMNYVVIFLFFMMVTIFVMLSSITRSRKHSLRSFLYKLLKSNLSKE